MPLGVLGSDHGRFVVILLFGLSFVKLAFGDEVRDAINEAINDILPCLHQHQAVFEIDTGSPKKLAGDQIVFV
jgi:hypothetical protein